MPAERGMTMQEAADVLRMSRRALQDVIKRHPYYYPVGRRKVFTSEDVERIRAALRLEGERERALAFPLKSAPSPSERAVFERLKKLTSKRR